MNEEISYACWDVEISEKVMVYLSMLLGKNNKYILLTLL